MIYLFMKSLKPTMREDKRYLLIVGEDLKKNIEKAILDFIGILGFSKVGLEFIKYDKDSAIISVNREMVDSVRASLCVFSKKIEVKMVSGTLKSLKDKL
jgi:RNase P/RNase MRP subunit POP5